MLEKLFPQFDVKDWHEINANRLAQAILRHFDFETGEPFRHPMRVNKWLTFLTEVLGVKYTYGGYMEDRGTLWAGHYMKPDEATHLGIDYNVPLDTEVFMPAAGKLVYSVIDTDQNGGWGGKLIFESLRDNKPYIIFGHLKDIVTKERVYEEGEVIGRIAEKERNGNWFPHLHVQCMRVYQPEIDGYGKLYEGIEKDFPRPETFLV